ncbi:MAG: hypothetical protein FKY71_14900 [Spiribacter salinus]|uniref:Uncharacterized protein n=1 Tax=Spiribacter salinus TaxID=1335746 RepID=A0A540VND0_9GAMM|nr:MAG: hypothetical protein FKY71_14900 [Spiribacter salinus]
MGAVVGTALLASTLLAACVSVDPSTGDSRHVGQPLIRDADGRITGYIDEKRYGPTNIRAPDGRILGTVQEGPGSTPTRIRRPDGRIQYAIDRPR